MKSRAFIYVSLGVDLLIAAFKFVAAAISGSASMLSEGIHSIIDAISQVLLIWGVKNSKRAADFDRPFGYGKDLYFWAFVVSLVIFSMGGCISFYEGVTRLNHPEMPDGVIWNYASLAFAFVFNLVSLCSGMKAFNKQRGKMPFWKAAIQTKDPSTIIVILGDYGDLLGLIVAFFGVFLSRLYHNPMFDAVASMVIGTILITISAFLIRESKSLLLGESISRKTLRRVITLAQADKAVIKVKKHFSTYLAPEDVLLQLNTVFKDDLNTQQIIEAIERIGKSIQSEFPKMKQIFIEPVGK
jgi:cation diffusion facilitator family transporter